MFLIPISLLAYRFSQSKNNLPYLRTHSQFPPTIPTNSDTAELPLDSVGCFTTCTFSWIRRYRVLDPPIQMQCGWPCWPFRRTRTPATGADSDIATAATNASTSPTSHDNGSPTHATNSADTTAASASPHDTPPPGVQDPVVPLLPASDRCEPNAKRLLGLYKYEEQSRGRIGASMTRVAWQFCRTRVLLATALHTLAHCMAVLMLAVFLQLAMLAIDTSWSRDVPDEYRSKQMLLQRRNMGNQVQTFVLMASLVGSLMAQNYLRSAAHAIGMR